MTECDRIVPKEITPNNTAKRMEENNTAIKNQPKPANNARQTELDQISYVDSDTHAREYCCCLHGWGTGPDSRWYYPWDKGVYRLLGLCCMWYCSCTFVPCLLCHKEFREIICCSDQCNNQRVMDENANDEIADA